MAKIRVYELARELKMESKALLAKLITSKGAAPYFTDVETLKNMATELGIDADANIITYCNSGQLASASWFVFSELMGNKNVKLYDGSMHQWALEKRPVVKTKVE